MHAGNFPEIVPVGSAPNDVVDFDSTTAFDEKIATEFVANKSTDPLTIGKSTTNGRDSDRRLFESDGRATITQLADPATFRSLCSTMLQKMIEVVPPGTVFTDSITPYEVKPYALQLTLLSGGSNLQFTGEIRVRTTVRPASQIASVKLVYKDRSGGSTCGSCTVNTDFKGNAAGFDDSFAVSSSADMRIHGQQVC